MTTYSEKLKDPRWQKLRLEVLNRDTWACQNCYDDTSTLAVHHLYYTKGTEPWEYPLNAFLTLCEGCHQQETDGRRASERNFMEDIRKIPILAVDLDQLSAYFTGMAFTHVREVVLEVLGMYVAQGDLQRRVIDIYFQEFLSKDNNK